MSPEPALAPAVRSRPPPPTPRRGSHPRRPRRSSPASRAPAPPPSKTTSSSASSALRRRPRHARRLRGALRELLDDPDDLLRTVLLPAEDRARVHAFHELHARWMQARLRRDGALTSPSHTRRYLEARLRGYRNEVFVAVFLDSRHRPIACEELFQGTVDGATVSIRAWWCAARSGTTPPRSWWRMDIRPA